MCKAVSFEPPWGHRCGSLAHFQACLRAMGDEGATTSVAELTCSAGVGGSL